MLSGLSKKRAPLKKLCEKPLNAGSRFFASTSTSRARPGFPENKLSDWRSDSSSGKEDSRTSFGLRPPDKQPWDESDPRFVNEDPELALRFGEASKTRAKLRIEGKLCVPKRTPALFPLTEQKLVVPPPWGPERRSIDRPHQIQNYGISSDIISMPRGREDSSRGYPPAQRTVPGRQNVSTFSRNTAPNAPTQYLMIQNFKGLRSDLAPVIDPFIDAQLHLVPVQTEDNKLRIDALMKFNTRGDALKAQSRLEAQGSALQDTDFEVQMIDKERWISAFSPMEDQSSMANLATPPMPSYPEAQPENTQQPRSGPHPIIWIGNIPKELLEDREEIVAKFSKYGKIVDVRIPDKGTGRPRGFMYLEFMRQEDADRCLQELTKRPLFLFGRRLRVDYAPSRLRDRPPLTPSQLEAARRSSNSILLSGLPSQLTADPWALLDAVSSFGEILDLRIIPSTRQSQGSAFVDFLHPEDTAKMIETVRTGGTSYLPPGIDANYASKYSARPDPVNNPPSDTLRAWGLPLRALSDKIMLREAFGDREKLLDIRIPKRHDGWPIGSIYLQFTSVQAAKETLDWIRSDPKNPITFFGRDICANFIENRRTNRRITSRFDTPTDYIDTLLTSGDGVYERSAGHTQSERRVWASGVNKILVSRRDASQGDTEASR